MQFQVIGQSGYTASCLMRLDMVLSGPSDIHKAIVLTKNWDEHLFILWERGGYPYGGIIIPTGFTSGVGEGARGFSLALCMIHECQIPIGTVSVPETVFDCVDRGEFPVEWRQQIFDTALPREMPIPSWIFGKHWELAKSRRLWRVQSWRWQNLVIKWTSNADVVDDFSKIVGDKLHQAAKTLPRNARHEDCQQVGLILRDAWIEFSRNARTSIWESSEKLGKNDVKGVVDALALPQATTDKAKKAYNSTNALQHSLNAVSDDALRCFTNTADAMAEIIAMRFPDKRDPLDEELIRPN